jgi:hypothetical protein
MKIKVCTKCGQEKSLDDFYKSNKSKDRLTWYCKVCIQLINKQYRKINPDYDKNKSKEWYYSHLKERNQYNKKFKNRDNMRRREDYKNNFSKYKEQHLKSAYGISLEDYFNMLESQNGVCAICGKEEMRINPKTKKVHLLSVDHNHATGKVRGLLCMKCNPGIGNFQENVGLLQNAIEYLKKFKREK